MKVKYIERDYATPRAVLERAVERETAVGMRRAELSAEEWRAKFDRGLPHFISAWELRFGDEPFSIHDMYDSGLPEAPSGGDAAGPAILAATRRGVIVKVGEKKSIRTTQHRKVSAYRRSA